MNASAQAVDHHAGDAGKSQGFVGVRAILGYGAAIIGMVVGDGAAIAAICSDIGTGAVVDIAVTGMDVGRIDSEVVGRAIISMTVTGMAVGMVCGCIHWVAVRRTFTPWHRRLSLTFSRLATATIADAPALSATRIIPPSRVANHL